MDYEQPDVTVVIPAYNGASFIRDAIESCIDQSDSSFHVEAIVVDDASTDNTCEIVYNVPGRVRLIGHSSNHGRHVARNHGLAAAMGPYVKFLDQDDYLEPGMLRTEFQLAESTQADIVISGHRTFEHKSEGPRVINERCIPPKMEPRIPAILDGAAVPTAAALYRRSYVEGLCWDGNVPRLDDWDWFVQAALRMGKIVPIDGVSYSWRKHPAQYTHSSTLVQYATDHHAILKKMELWLRDHDELTQANKSRLAQYYYKMLRVIYKHDRVWYGSALRHIFQLDPSFFPYCEPRDDVRKLCRIVGVRAGLFVYNRVADAVHCLKTTLNSGRECSISGASA